MSSTLLAISPAAMASSLADEVRALARTAATLVARVDEAAQSGVWPGGEAASVASALATVERLAGAGRTLAAGRVATTGEYRSLGFPTAAHWLASVTGDGVGAAGRAVATAAHLDGDGLAATRAAFAGGALTGDQAAEIARTAASAPEEEARLLALAGRETTKGLRDECRRVRLAGQPDDGPQTKRERLAREMAFRTSDLGNGMGELFARMPSAWLVRIAAAVREQSEAIFDQHRKQGHDDPLAAYQVEALMTLVLFGDLTGVGTGPEEEAAEAPAEPAWEGFDDPLYRELLASIGGEAPPAPPPRAERRRRRRGRCTCGGRVVPRAKILVRVDQSALLRGSTEGEEVCDIAGFGPVPVATVRDLWPDAVVKLVLTKGADVAHVTHLGRRATEAMATAMQWASPRCSNVACDNDRFLEVDHRLGWANVQRTRVDELDGLCSSCHAWKTRDDWQLVRGRGRRRFVPPTDPDHPGDPPTPHRRF